MDHITVFEKTHHMDNGIHGADMAQKLVSQPLSGTGTADKTGNVDEFQA